MSRNRWVLPRNKRDLKSIPKIVAVLAGVALNQQWSGERGIQLTLEDALEKAEIKGVGERRDQSAGGARTYVAQCAALGLVFVQASTGYIMLTQAGQAILEGKSPVKILTNQLMKFQYPSPYSLGRGVDINPDFRIRPFRFLLKLLLDERIGELTQEEIGKIVVTEATCETNTCYEKIVRRILEFRAKGNECLPKDFVKKHDLNPAKPYANLNDTANTFINYLDYTQLIEREKIKGKGEGKSTLKIRDERKDDVIEILATNPPLIKKPDIDSPEKKAREKENFQRKFGVDPWHKKETKNLIKAKTITQQIITENLIKQAYLDLASKRPIFKITPEVVAIVAEKSGVEENTVERSLQKNYPHGSVSVFMVEYYEMAFNGTDDAIAFEKATTELFKNMFGFEAKHVGPKGLTPDVLLISDAEGYQAIIDNKAYSKYTIESDHRLRMVDNYIGGLGNYSNSDFPLAFFSYIAGGFGPNFDSQLRKIVDATGVNGSGISVHNMIKLVENYNPQKYTHAKLRDIFSVNRQILLSDILN